MAVQPKKNSGAFHGAFARQMHAPVQIFIGAIVGAAGEQGSANDSPAFQQHSRDDEGNNADGDDCRAVPPGHGNRVFVFFVDQVVGLVGLENLVMNHGVLFERIGKETDAFVHHEAMQCPFEEGREYRCNYKTDRRPEEEERCHGFKGGWYLNLTQSIGDTGLGEIVRRHLETDAVANGEAHKMAPHFAGDMGKDFMLVIQHHSEHRTWQNRLNRSFQLNGLLTTHILHCKLDFPTHLGFRKLPTGSLPGILAGERSARKRVLYGPPAQEIIACARTFFPTPGSSFQ